MGLKDECEGGVQTGGIVQFGMTCREERMKRMVGLRAKFSFCLRSEDMRAAKRLSKSLQDGQLRAGEFA